MNEYILPLLAFPLGVLSGFIGGIASGGGLISIPGLMFLGLPPSAAIATNNFNIVSSLTSAARYHRHGVINMRLVKSLVSVSVLGGLLGSLLLLSIDINLMQKLFGLVCLLLTALISVDKQFRRVKVSHKLLAPVLIFLADIFAGMFGTGGGLLVIYVLSRFYGLTFKEANANSKLIALGGVAAILIVFLHAGVINFYAGIPLMAGSAIGGYIGANTALKKEEKLVRNILAIIAIASGIKLLI